MRDPSNAHTLCCRPSYSWILISPGVIKGFSCREGGGLVCWGKQWEGKVSAIAHGTCPSLLPCSSQLWPEENPSPSWAWGEAAWRGEMHNEPCLGWKSFSSSSSNTLASGDWPSYNCISLCYWSLGLPELKLHLISLAPSRVCSASTVPSVPCVSQTGHFCDLLFLL